MPWQPKVSLTRTVIEVAGLAAAVGVPLMMPVLAFNVRPAGNVPAVIVHVPYGPVPPVAVSDWLYTLPTVPCARLVGVMLIAGHTGVTA